MIRILSFPLFLLFSLVVYGQDKNGNQLNISSPSATEMVRYQRVPVSYYNGLPQIDIPLYTAQSRDLSLPISLSYHAGGIRVDQYPTDVGLAWNLNCGGSIIRVVNGFPDERVRKDLEDEHVGFSLDPGYFFTSQNLAGNEWYNQDSIFYHNRSYLDGEPDEFIVNAYGISGSFFFYRDSQNVLRCKIKSNNGEMFRVEIPEIASLAINDEKPRFAGGSPGQYLEGMNIHSLIRGFILVKQDGTRLEFGGGYDFMEFTTMPRVGGNNILLKTIPTAWMLRKVTSSSGNSIRFSYHRDGSPVIVSDSRCDVWVYSRSTLAQLITPDTGDEYRGRSFHVIHPLYPDSIKLDGGLSIVFEGSRSYDSSVAQKILDRNYLRSISGFSGAGASYDGSSPGHTDYKPFDYFWKIDKIKVLSMDCQLRNIDLHYIENQNERLKLDLLTITGYGSDPDIEQYSFGYNQEKMPAYHSTKQDNWGFYNNRDFRAFLQNTVSDWTTLSNPEIIYNYRKPVLEYARADMLEEICYPTGGTLKLEYELNDYSKVATQAPDFMLRSESGTSGGLRIHRLRYTESGMPERIQEFIYKSEDGNSSGILSGIPRYYDTGMQFRSYRKRGWDGGFHYDIHAVTDFSYVRYDESQVNPVSITNGNHTTYSRVIEKIGGVNPLTKVYSYSNHDVYPDCQEYGFYTNMLDSSAVARNTSFTSLEGMRGLLLQEEWMDADGEKVFETIRNYKEIQQDSNDFMRCMDNFVVLSHEYFSRVTPYRKLVAYPVLLSSISKEYSPITHALMDSTMVTYEWKDSLRLGVEKSWSSQSAQKLRLIRYADDMAVSGNTSIYGKMQKRGMTGIGIEELVLESRNVISGKSRNFSEYGDRIMLQGEYKLSQSVPVPYADFRPQGTYGRDSRYSESFIIESYNSTGNPTWVRGEDGTVTSYAWDSTGSNPVAVITNAWNRDPVTEQRTVQKTLSQVLSASNLNSNVRSLTFTNDATGSVSIRISASIGNNWFVACGLDGRAFNLIDVRGGDTASMPWSGYASRASSSVITFQYIPAGTHTLSISFADNNHTSWASASDGSLSVTYMATDTYTVTEGCEEWYFNDFESEEGNAPVGFHSNRGKTGPFLFTPEGLSDRRYILEYDQFSNGSWQHIERNVQRGVITVGYAGVVLDNVCLHPADSEVCIYTWYPHVGMRSKRDGKGRLLTYEYDSLGRLSAVYDVDGNMVNHYKKHLR